MNIIEFVSQFPDEESCRSHFKESREKEGIVCKNCRSVNHWWLKAKVSGSVPNVILEPH